MLYWKGPANSDIFVQVYRAANSETFLGAQQLMFDFFGGVPRRVIFDNAKVAVKEGFGLYAKPQDRYLAFSAIIAATSFFVPTILMARLLQVLK